MPTHNTEKYKQLLNEVTGANTSNVSSVTNFVKKSYREMAGSQVTAADANFMAKAPPEKQRQKQVCEHCAFRDNSSRCTKLARSPVVDGNSTCNYFQAKKAGSQAAQPAAQPAATAAQSTNTTQTP